MRYVAALLLFAALAVTACSAPEASSKKSRTTDKDDASGASDGGGGADGDADDPHPTGTTDGGAEEADAGEPDDGTPASAAPTFEALGFPTYELAGEGSRRTCTSGGAQTSHYTESRTVKTGAKELQISTTAVGQSYRKPAITFQLAAYEDVKKAYAAKGWTAFDFLIYATGATWNVGDTQVNPYSLAFDVPLPIYVIPSEVAGAYATLTNEPVVFSVSAKLDYGTPLDMTYTATVSNGGTDADGLQVIELGYNVSPRPGATRVKDIDYDRIYLPNSGTFKVDTTFPRLASFQTRSEMAYDGNACGETHLAALDAVVCSVVVGTKADLFPHAWCQ